MITLNDLKPHHHRRKYKRVGRGNASGKGTTAGRGTKGQRARTGGRNKLIRRGLAHLITRTPKIRGFQSRRSSLAVITLAELARRYADDATVNRFSLVKLGLLSKRATGVKIVGRLEMKKKLRVYAVACSKSAADSIRRAGGTITAVDSRPPKDAVK